MCGGGVLCGVNIVCIDDALLLLLLCVMICNEWWYWIEFWYSYYDDV